MRCGEQELRHLYLEKNMTAAEIGHQLGIPTPTIHSALRRLDIPRRKSGCRPGQALSPETQFKPGVHPSPKTEFKEGIRNSGSGWNKGLTKETDSRVKIQSEKVSKKLKGKPHKDERFAFGKDFYNELYWNQGLSLQGIAQRLGCRPCSVVYYMKKYSLLRRPKAQATRRKPTAPELRLNAIMVKHKLPYRYVGDGKVIFEGYNPDFINVNGAKGIIELFGDYWHTTRIKRWRDTEGGRSYHFSKFGFKTLVLWENELANEKAVVNKIQRFTKNLKEEVSSNAWK